jgi:hypothetical protein
MPVLLLCPAVALFGNPERVVKKLRGRKIKAFEQHRGEEKVRSTTTDCDPILRRARHWLSVNQPSLALGCGSASTK